MFMRDWLADWIHSSNARARNRAARRARVRLEPTLNVRALEVRQVLNAAPVPVDAAPPPPPAVVVVDAGQFQNDQTADAFRVVREGENVNVYANDQLVHSMAADSNTAVQINGSGDADTLVVDFAGGNPLSNLSVQFNASAGDQLVLTGGDVGDVAYNLEGATSSTVNIDGAVVEFSADVQVVDQLTAANRSFEVDGDAVLSDAADDATSLTTSQGDSVSFTTPGQALVIDSADGDNDADSVTVESLDASFTADLSIQGDSADTATFAGVADLHGGDLQANSGTIQVTGNWSSSGASMTFTATAEITVSESAVLTSHAGTVVIDAGPEGTTLVSGQIDVSNPTGTGGQITLLGKHVGLLGAARIDANGQTGGGTVLVGGDYQGKNPDVRNSKRVYMGEDAVITASALESGNGGKVILWADEITRFYGHVEARGADGLGGFAEISGKEHLAFAGTVDLLGGQSGGTLLLDPKNITIANGGADVVATNNEFAENAAGDVTFDADLITALLNVGTNVQLEANNDITINEAILVNNPGGDGGNILLLAGRSIFINANVTTDNGDFQAVANFPLADAANRDDDNPGVSFAELTMADGTTINAGTGNIELNIETGIDATNNDSGHMVVENLTTTGIVLVLNQGPTAGSSILAASSDGLITAGTAILVTQSTGSSIGTSAERIRVTVTNLEIGSQSGGAFITSPTAGVNLGSVPLSSLGSVGVTTTGDFSLITAGNITQSERLSVTGATTLNAGAGGNITLSTATNNFGGAVTITTADAVVLVDTNALTLDTSSAGSIDATAGTTLTVDGKLTVTGAVDLDANGGNLTVNADIDPTTVLLESNDDVVINAAVVASVSITVNAGLGVGASGSVDLQAAGSLAASDAGATISMTAGATTGNVILDGTTNSGNEQTTVTAAAGNINGAGLVTAATVDLNASTGIGNTTALELAAGSISADTTTGNINIDNALATAVTVTSLTTGATNTILFEQFGGGAVSFTTVTTNDGNITLQNTAGNLTVGTSVTAGGAGDIQLTTVASGAININGTVTAAGDRVTITTAGQVNQAGGAGAAITADELRLTGSGPFLLTNANNDIAILAADVTQALSYTDANDFAVGTLGITVGIATSNDDVTLVIAGAGNTLTLPDNLVGFDTIRTNGGTVTLQVDNLTINTGGANEAINTGSGNVIIHENAAARSISIGAEVGTDLSLTEDELNEIVVTGAGFVQIGRTATDLVTLQDSIAPTTFSTLLIVSGSDLDTSAPTDSITIANLAIDVDGDIGAGDPLQIDVTNFAARSRTSGSIDVDDADDLTIATVAGLVGVTTTGGAGNFTADAGTTLVVNSKVLVVGAVDLAANNGNLTVNASIDPTAVLLEATDDVIIDALVEASVSITVNAGTDTTGSVDLQASGSLEASDAGATILVNAGTAAGNVTLTGTIDSGNEQTTVNATAGNINGAGLVTAATVDLNAATGIGNTTALELAASTITADTTNGDIDIDNTLATAVTVTSLTTGTGNITFDQSGGGNVSFGTVTTTSGNIDLENIGGNLTVATAVTAGTAGDITLTTTTTGNIILTGTTTAAGDQVTATSAGNINGAGLVTASVVDLNAVTGIGNTTQLELAAQTITADTTNGDIDIDNASAADVTVTTLTTGTGNITFDQSGGGNVSFATVTTTVQGNIDLENIGGNLTVGTAINAGGTGDITLTTTTTGNIILTGTTTAAGDQVTATSAGDINGAGLVTASVVDLNAVTGIGNTTQLELAAQTITADTTNGDIDIDNASAADVTVTTLTTGTGNITFDQSGGGNVSFGTVTTTSGNIDLENIGGNLTVATAVTAGTAGDITLTTTTTGNIILTGTTTAAGDQVTATSAGNINGAGLVTASVVDLNAVTGIGNTTQLELAAQTITADTTNGDIDIDNTSAAAVTVTSLTTGTGDITFDQSGGGAVSFTTVTTTVQGNIDLSNTGADLTVGTAVTAGGTGDITLTTITTGNIILTGTTTAAGDQVTATSAGNINGAGLVTASVVDLNAVTGIGNTTQLELAAQTITADTTNGDIDIDNASAADVTVTTLTTGTGNITFDQSGGGNVSFGTVTTTSGNIDLENIGGNLTVATAVTAGTAGDITLTTTTTGNIILTGTTTAAGDQVTATSAGNINGAGLVTASVVDLNAVTGIGNTTQLELAAQTITADTTNGDIDIDNASAADVTVTTLTTGTGNITFDQSGGGNVSFATVTTTVQGNIDLENIGGDLTVGTAINAGGTGDITLTTTTTGNIILTGTTTAAGDQVTATSAGNINGAGLVTASVVDLNAVTGIGNTTQLELAAQTITADTTNGDIDIDNASAADVTVTTLTTGTGNITFDQSGGGNITFATVTTTVQGNIDLENIGGNLTVGTAINAGGTGDISLTTTTTGNIILTGTTTAAGDQVTATSAGNINGAGLVTAATIDLNAVTGIGNTTALELAGSTISADTTNGNIDIDNTLATAVSVTSLTTGNGTILFEQSGGGTVSFTTVTTGDGDITLRNTVNSLTVVTAVTAGGTGNVILEAIGATSDVILDGNVSADGDEIHIRAGRDIAQLAADDFITALALLLEAGRAIGVGAVNSATGTGSQGAAAIDVRVGTVAARAGTSGTLDADDRGDIFLNQDEVGGSLIVGTVNSLIGAGTIAGIQVQAGENGDVFVQTENGTLTVDGEIRAQGDGNVLLIAGDNTGVVDQDLVLNETVAAGLNSTDVGANANGDVHLSAARDIVQLTNTEFVAGGAVLLEAGRAIGVAAVGNDGTGSQGAAAIDLVANIVAARSGLRTESRADIFIKNTSGTFLIQTANSLIGDMNASVDVSGIEVAVGTNGDVFVQNGVGGLQVLEDVTARGDGNVLLITQNDLGLGATVTAGANGVDVGANANGDVHLSATGNITQSSANEFVIGDAVLLEAGGAIGVFPASEADPGATAIDIRATTVAARAVSDIFITEDALGGDLIVGRTNELVGDMNVVTNVDGIVSTVGNVFVRVEGAAANLTVVDNLGINTIRVSDRNIILEADNMVLGTGNAAFAVDSDDGRVILRTHAATRGITLGSNAIAADLNLSDAELNEILAGDRLEIGDRDFTGDVTLRGNVTFNAANVTNLLVTTGASALSDTAAAVLTVQNLGIDVGQDIGADAAAGTNRAVRINADTLAARALTGAINIEEENNLVIGDFANTVNALAAFPEVDVFNDASTTRRAGGNLDLNGLHANLSIFLFLSPGGTLTQLAASPVTSNNGFGVIGGDIQLNSDLNSVAELATLPQFSTVYQNRGDLLLGEVTGQTRNATATTVTFVSGFNVILTVQSASANTGRLLDGNLAANQVRALTADLTLDAQSDDIEDVFAFNADLLAERGIGNGALNTGEIDAGANDNANVASDLVIRATALGSVNTIDVASSNLDALVVDTDGITPTNGDLYVNAFSNFFGTMQVSAVTSGTGNLVIDGTAVGTRQIDQVATANGRIAIFAPQGDLQLGQIIAQSDAASTGLLTIDTDGGSIAELGNMRLETRNAGTVAVLQQLTPNGVFLRDTSNAVGNYGFFNITSVPAVLSTNSPADVGTTVGKESEVGFNFVFDFDDPVRAPIPGVSVAQDRIGLVFSNTYTVANPDNANFFDLNFVVSISNTFNIEQGNTRFERVEVTISIPSSGLGIFNPELIRPQVIAPIVFLSPNIDVPAAPNTLPIQTTNQNTAVAPPQTTTRELQYVVLQIVPDSEETPVVRTLKQKDLQGGELFDMLADLPDGKYRLKIKRGERELQVLEFIMRGGKVINPQEDVLEQLRRLRRSGELGPVNGQNGAAPNEARLDRDASRDESVSVTLPAEEQGRTAGNWRKERALAVAELPQGSFTTASRLARRLNLANRMN